MKKISRNYNLTLQIRIEISLDYLSKDVAMLALLEGVGNRNYSKYTKEEFVKEINNGNVLVAMLEDDPIAYAIVNNNRIVESYISYSFRNTNIDKLFEDFLKQLP